MEGHKLLLDQPEGNQELCSGRCHVDQRPSENFIFLKLELGSLVAQANVQLHFFVIFVFLVALALKIVPRC